MAGEFIITLGDETQIDKIVRGEFVHGRREPASRCGPLQRRQELADQRAPGLEARAREQRAGQDPADPFLSLERRLARSWPTCRATATPHGPDERNRWAEFINDYLRADTRSRARGRAARLAPWARASWMPRRDPLPEPRGDPRDVRVHQGGPAQDRSPSGPPAKEARRLCAKLGFDPEGAFWVVGQEPGRRARCPGGRAGGRVKGGQVEMRVGIVAAFVEGAGTRVRAGPGAHPRGRASSPSCIRTRSKGICFSRAPTKSARRRFGRWRTTPRSRRFGRRAADTGQPASCRCSIRGAQKPQGAAEAADGVLRLDGAERVRAHALGLAVAPRADAGAEAVLRAARAGVAGAAGRVRGEKAAAPVPSKAVASVGRWREARTLLRAPMVGGNLAVRTSLIGTPYAAQARGKIVFLEDVDENSTAWTAWCSS